MLCTEEGCKEGAEYTYIWPWGTQGACCGSHRLQLMQRATQQLDTTLQFTVIDPGKPMPISRDERAGYRAKIIVLEEDVASLNATIAQHIRNGSELAEELRRQRAIGARLEQELREARETVDVALADRDNARAEAGVALQERDRLELIIRSVPATDAHPTAHPPAGE